MPSPLTVKLQKSTNHIVIALPSFFVSSVQTVWPGLCFISYNDIVPYDDMWRLWCHTPCAVGTPWGFFFGGGVFFGLFNFFFKFFSLNVFWGINTSVLCERPHFTWREIHYTTTVAACCKRTNASLHHKLIAINLLLSRGSLHNPKD